MNPALQGYVDALLESIGDTAGTLASEAEAVARLVHGSRQLRSALTDTSVNGPTRRALMDDLLGNRVSLVTRRAVGFAVSSTRGPEVPAALNWLAQETTRASEGRRHEGPPLGRLAARERVGGYVSALDEELSIGELEDLEDALFRLARTIDANPPLRRVLTDRDLPVRARLDVVDDLLGGKLAEAGLRLVRYVVRAGRPRDVVATLDWVVERIAEARGWRVARVRAARDVDQEQRDRLAESLAHLVGRPVDLQVTEDPELLGGAVVEVGDLQVDASVRGRLDRLAEHLRSGRWQEARLGAPEGAETRGGSAGAPTAEGARG